MNFKKKLLILLAAILMPALCACGGDQQEPTTTAVSRDEIYLNLDMAVYGGVDRQMDRDTGLYTIRFLLDGQIVSLQTGDEKVVQRIDRLKTLALEFDGEGLIKNAASAQSGFGGAFYDYMTVTSPEGNSISFDGSPASLEFAENYRIYDVTGLTGEYGIEGSLKAGDSISCYVNRDGYVTEVYILERHETHDDSHSCDHCGQSITWTPWDGTTELSTGHYRLNGDVTLDEPMELKEQVVLCLNGYTLTGKSRVFNVNKGAQLSVVDHKTALGEYKGKLVGGGVPSANKEIEQIVGGGIYIANGASVALYSGELTSKPQYTVYQGGVIYSEGTFAIHGGVVTGCQVRYNGGALYLGEGGTFQMDGGIMRYGEALKDEEVGASGRGGTIYVSTKAEAVHISGGKLIAGTAVGFGGGLYTELSMVVTGGELTGDRIGGVNAEYGGVFCTGGAVEVEFMEGVMFYGGAATEGGNLSCRTKSVVTLHEGVVVKDGYGDRNGGNMAIFGTVNIEGATIRDGRTTGAGGNIYCYTNGNTNLNIHGGTVANGTAGRGGNISMNGNSDNYENGPRLNIYGGVIANGTAATGAGGNVEMRVHSVMTMTGGQIVGGTAATYGGGLATLYNNEQQVGPTVSLGGDAQISGNMGSDVFLGYNTFLSVLAETPFTANARIGIQAEDPAAALATDVLTDCSAVFTWTPGDKQVVWDNNKLIVK